MADELRSTEESSSRQRGAGGSRKGHRIRLYHHKSRAGCQRCKARRVKCDEQRPTCGACTRHNVDCIYEEAAESSSSAQGLRSQQGRPIPVEQGARLGPFAFSETAVNTVYNNNLLGIPGMRELRSLELRLIHHYLSAVAYNPNSAFRASGNPFAQPENFPKLFGFVIENENVLYATCALSATHLLFTGGVEGSITPAETSRGQSPAVTSEPTAEIADPTTLARAHDDYLFLALSEQREAVANLNAGNINGVCFAAMQIMTNELASLVDRDLEPYEPPMRWLQMGRGVGAVFDTAVDKMHILDPAWGSNVMHVVDPGLENEQNAADAILRMGETGQRLLTPTALPGDDLNKDTYHIYKYAVKYMGALWQAVDAGTHPGVIAIKTMAFPSWEPSEFVDFIAEGRPRALVMLAHVFRAAYGLQGTWWITSVPEHEVMGIWQVLPQEWRYLLPDETMGP